MKVCQVFNGCLSHSCQKCFPLPTVNHYPIFFLTITWLNIHDCFGECFGEAWCFGVLETWHSSTKWMTSIQKPKVHYPVLWWWRSFLPLKDKFDTFSRHMPYFVKFHIYRTCVNLSLNYSLSAIADFSRAKQKHLYTDKFCCRLLLSMYYGDILCNLPYVRPCAYCIWMYVLKKVTLHINFQINSSNF